VKQVRVDTLAGDRPPHAVAIPPPALLSALARFLLSKLGHAGDGLRTNCETTVPSVKRDIKEMIPSEITQ
jgi:hypothetical protein